MGGPGTPPTRYHAPRLWLSRRREPPVRGATSGARTHKAGKARLNQCPRCHSPRLPHRVCPTCGTYAGREVIAHKVAEPTAAPSDAQE